MTEAVSKEFDIVGERYLLSQALLKATASMTRCTEPEAVLRAICDSFPSASPHIRLAWMMMGNVDVNTLYPQYAVGPAAVRAHGVRLARNPLPETCPVFEAVKNWSTVSSDMLKENCPVLAAVDSGHTARCDFLTANAPDSAKKFCSVVVLPVGQKGAQQSGIVVLYADLPGYFEYVGKEFLEAFVHLANASLDQCALLSNLTHVASHDSLTGVLNRRGIQECMERELSRSVRKRQPLSIVLFDVDRFKLVNDRLGHKEGDIVLRGVTDAVRPVLRGEDWLGRWGGEEFICVMPDTAGGDAMVAAERMRRKLQGTEIEVSSGKVNVTASFGVSAYPDDAECIDKLIAAADAALYQAKRSGRDRCVGAGFVQQDIYSVGNMLDAALRDNRIIPAYQPIVDLRSGQVVAEETLARLVTPGGEVVSAARFVEAASQLQLLHRIDQAIVTQAFSHCAVGLQTGTNRLSHFVNISADLLRHTELVDEMLNTARTYCSSCAGLMSGDVKPMVIEITERELLADIDMARKLLMPFIDFGMRLALDDFGSGYSSYQYLADLPVDFLKIDGTLIKRVDEPKVRAIVEGIQDMAEKLGIITLAEFVEDAETEKVLKEIGVHWAQGYYYGKPEVVTGQGAPSLLCRTGTTEV